MVLASSALGMTYEKRPGATNPSVDPGDKFRFSCSPGNHKLSIDERGQVFSDKAKKKTRSLPTNSAAGFHISFLECSVRGKEVLYAYEESNGPDAGVVAGRCDIAGGACKWRVSIGVPGAGVPSFGDKTVTLALGILDVDLSLETGKMSKWRGTGCLTLVRYDAAGKRAVESVGPDCEK